MLLLTYDDDTTVMLTGDITERDALAFTNSPFNFTISQSTSADTPIGAFGVSGGIAGEYLDGIVSGGTVPSHRPGHDTGVQWQPGS